MMASSELTAVMRGVSTVLREQIAPLVARIEQLEGQIAARPDAAAQDEATERLVRKLGMRFLEEARRAS